MNFTKTFFAALLAFVVGNALFVFFSFFMLIMFVAMLGGDSATYSAPKLKNNSVLMIDLEGGIADSPPTSAFVSNGFGRMSFNNSITILQAVAAIESATEDDHIQGIYIDVGYGNDISLANTEELRAALKKFGESGKFIVSYADNYSQLGYYLSSVADRVYLNPQGEIDWRGVSSSVMFYKGLLDKLDIHAEIIRHGSFKSAVEPFMLDRMSPESRVQMNAMLGSIWDVILSDISESRGIEKQVLAALASDLTIDSPQMAYDCGMIDGIIYEDEMMDMLGRLAEGYETIGSDEFYACDEESGEIIEIPQDSLEEDNPFGEFYTVEDSVATSQFDSLELTELATEGIEPDSVETYYEEEEYSAPVPNILTLAEYIDGHKPSHSSRSAKQNKIAIVYADGDITGGESHGESIGGKTIAEKLKSAREDESVKAIVLRVNSPGGSMLGSEVIWREMELTRMEKPLIVSMGGMAASGGYYISTPADVIMADRMTITGSIGVFSILFDVGAAMEQNLGITVDVAKTNPSADLGSGYRGLSSFERRFFQRQVEAAYSTFIGHVADGRNMTTEEVDSIGGGRVWSGVDAVENGLVDGYGGIVDAITLAAERAGIESDYSILEVVDSPDNISSIISSLLGSEDVRMHPALSESLRQYNAVINMLDAENGIQARLLYDIVIL